MLYSYSIINQQNFKTNQYYSTKFINRYLILKSIFKKLYFQI